MSTRAHGEIGEILQANRASHRARWSIDPCGGVTAGRSTAVGESTAGRRGLSGLPLQLQLPDGAWRQVHVADRPLEEARAWLGAALRQTPLPPAICVIGAGAGWVVDAMEELPGEMRILVFEPEPTFCVSMFERRDYRGLIDAGRLMVLGGPAFEGAPAAWRLFGRLADEPPLLVHPVIGLGRRQATVEAARLARKAIADAQANERARRRFAAPYLINTLKNVPTLARESDAGVLFDWCPGTPVVIAGAGPSLNRNLEELRPYRDRVVFVAADTALRPSLAAGVVPDFVVAVDPGAANARHLTRLPPCPQTALVAEASIQSGSFDAFDGRTFLFRVAAHHPWPWLAAAGVDVVTLRAWGSVLITAFDLGVRLAGDPLMLIGADLAYTGGQPYCRGTVYEDDWADRVARGERLEDIWRGAIAMHRTVVESHAGETVATAPHLVQFRDALVHAAQSAPSRVVNATGAGILRGGRVDHGTLAALLGDRPAIRPLPLSRRLPAATVVASLRTAVRDLAQSASTVPYGEPDGEPDGEPHGRPDGWPDGWAAVLEEHQPSDPTLAGQVAAVHASLGRWAVDER